MKVNEYLAVEEFVCHNFRIQAEMANRPRNRILPPTPEAVDGMDHGGMHGSEDKLFIQLLDDLDNISGGDQSIHRRRRAREIFSEWLFSQDVRNPQMMRLKAEQTSGRRHSGDTIDDGCRKQILQQHSCDVEPFQREQSARRSCGGLNDGVQRRPASSRRPRPSSYHYPSDVRAVFQFAAIILVFMNTLVSENFNVRLT